MNVLNICMIKKDKYYVFLNMLKFEECRCMSKYKYEYDENVKLSIYYPTF